MAKSPTSHQFLLKESVITSVLYFGFIPILSSHESFSLFLPLSLYFSCFLFFHIYILSQPLRHFHYFHQTCLTYHKRKCRKSISLSSNDKLHYSRLYFIDQSFICKTCGIQFPQQIVQSIVTKKNCQSHLFFHNILAGVIKFFKEYFFSN